MDHYDVVVVGGGIAGVSLGSELAKESRVCVLEARPFLFDGSTGRSAATFVETHGDEVVRRLTCRSREVFQSQAYGWPSTPLQPLPLLRLATAAEQSMLADLHRRVSADVPDARLVGPAEIQRLYPSIRPGYASTALYEPRAMQIDVDLVCVTYRRHLIARGGEVLPRFTVTEARRDGSGVIVRGEDGREVHGTRIVIAAGASSGRVGDMVGAVPLHIAIHRRTLFLLEPTDGRRIPHINLACAAPNRFYLRPEGDRMLCSPADEDLVDAEDPAPDELQVARALDEIHRATLTESRIVKRVWAASRSRVADGLPVVGFDPVARDVFWFTGFFGFGIQANPALVEVAMDLFTTGAANTPPGLAQRLSPSRLTG